MTRQIDYEGASPSGTTTYTLFDSTAVPALAGAVGKHYRYYSRAMKVTAAGLIKGYASANGGVSWYQFHQRSVLPNATLAFMDEDSVPICPHADVKFTWTNGGSAQSVFYVGQSLCEVEEPLTNHGYDDPLNLVGGSMAHPVQVSGAEVQVGPKGQLLAQLQWDATGSPIGSFVLEYTRDGTTWKTVPTAYTEFTYPSGAVAGNIVCYWKSLQVFKRVRVTYVSASGGTLNTSLAIQTFTW